MVEVGAWRIRPVVPQEVAAIAALDRGEGGASWTEEAYAGELRLSWSHVEAVEPCLVAPAGAGNPPEIAGVMVYWIVADEVQLLNILTAPGHRRKGIGRFMMAHLRDRARAAGALRITLEVRRSNDAAIALYLAFGFREVGARRGYYSRSGEDAIIMECAL